MQHCIAPTACLVAAFFFLVGDVSAEHHNGKHKDSTEGFVALFDGESIDDWVQRGGVAKYTVEGGEIVGTAVKNTPNSFLCTPREYGDFVLTLEFKVHPRLNSGIMIRAQSSPDYKDGRVHGYQAEIDPSDRRWTGGIYDESRRGWLNDLKKNDAAREAFRSGEWNNYRIRCEGTSIKTWLNGVPAADLVDDVDAAGFIGLQVHNIGKREADVTEAMTVRWRNLMIKELKQKN